MNMEQRRNGGFGEIVIPYESKVFPFAHPRRVRTAMLARKTGNVGK